MKPVIGVVAEAAAGSGAGSQGAGSGMICGGGMYAPYGRQIAGIPQGDGGGGATCCISGLANGLYPCAKPKPSYEEDGAAGAGVPSNGPRPAQDASAPAACWLGLAAKNGGPALGDAGVPSNWPRPAQGSSAPAAWQLERAVKEGGPGDSGATMLDP